MQSPTVRTPSYPPLYYSCGAIFNDAYQAAWQYDLAWLIASPNLTDTSFLPTLSDVTYMSMHEQCRSWLVESLNEPPERADERIPLGRYAERLIIHALKARLATKVYAHNLVISDRGQTIGECDAIAHLPGSNTGPLHIEISVKFYLNYKNTLIPSHWVGPNGKDRLSDKLIRLRQHQTHLLSHPAAREALAALELAHAAPFVWFKGYLFYPYEDFFKQTYKSPRGINPNHARGWWCLAAQSAQAFSQPTSPEQRWMVLPKSAWLRPIHDGRVTPPETTARLTELLRAHFSASSEAVMVAAVSPCSDTHWLELHRGFVLAAHPEAKGQQVR